MIISYSSWCFGEKERKKRILCEGEIKYRLGNGEEIEAATLLRLSRRAAAKQFVDRAHR